MSNSNALPESKRHPSKLRGLLLLILLIGYPLLAWWLFEHPNRAGTTVLWLGGLPHPVKIVIAGNHDFCFEDTPDQAQACLIRDIFEGQ